MQNISNNAYYENQGLLSDYSYDIDPLLEKHFFEKKTPDSLHKIAAVFISLILSPILLLSLLAIMFESKGNPIYSQVRVGLNGRRFKIYKFRSMYIEGDKKRKSVDNLSSSRKGICSKFINDPRITYVGKFIRKSSIDELPQLWNVIKGDMQLIGPRPALPSEVDLYDSRAMNRLEVKPGLTGLWQVSGRADTTFAQQVSFDLEYIENRSFFFDLKILFLTIPAVLSGKGAY